MEQLNDIAVFVRVVEAGTFTAAAKQLDLSKAAVSKYVSRLERRLGARLLQRTTRRLAMTEAGEALFRRGAGALAELAGAEQDVAQLTGAPRGHLRISAPVFYGVARIAPLLAEFRRRFPEVSVELDLDDRYVDLVEERFDVALRIASETSSPNLHARRLGTSELLVVGSPDYFRRHRAPKVPADLRAHECLLYTMSRTPREWRLVSPKGEAVSVAVNGSFRANNDFALKQAALDGLGLGWSPSFLVEDELKAGRLVRALAGWRSRQLSINAVYASKKQLLPKVRVFVDFLAERLGG